MAEPARSDRSRAEPRTVAALLGDLDRALRRGDAAELVPVPTGFRPLDGVLGGGLHPGELVLVGGMPGVGKTVAALQWARNVAAAGGTAIYVCYEHEESELLMRLLSLEMGELPFASAPEVDRMRSGFREAAGRGGARLAEALGTEALARRAYDSVVAYGERLILLRASGTHTGLPEVEQLLAGTGGSPAVLFVDYLQKVAVRPEPAGEGGKVTKIAEGLKDLALAYRVPVVAVVASDREGLKSRRLRLHHLRGSAALASECDVAIILNEKFDAVSKVHLVYDTVRAGTFRSRVVFSVEKNRGGPNLVDLEFTKDFHHFRFDPAGGVVAENLVDERIYVE